MHPIQIVAGPTGSGKTKFALELAQRIDGELISADSRQIYKYLDIGTNKGKLTQVGQQTLHLDTHSFDLPIHHPVIDGFAQPVGIHMIGFLEPDQEFSAYQFQQLTYSLITQIENQGKVPIVVGGTGLYIDTLLHPERYTAAAPDQQQKQDLRLLSLAQLQQKLTALEPDAHTRLNNSDWHNPRRLQSHILRSSAHSQKANNAASALTFEKHYLDTEPEKLESVLRTRAQQMWDAGIVAEVERVLGMGFPRNSIALQGVGYRQVLQYLFPRSSDEEISAQQCVELIARAHLQYAKRQRTWFGKYFS